MSSPTLSSDRLRTLDALRGLAAIMVVLYHVTGSSSGPIGSGFLAVDFFFALSGLVIARTYHQRLRGGMAPNAFIATRAIRLYPMLALGLALDAVVKTVMVAQGKIADIDPADVVAGLATGAVFLPSPPTHRPLFLLDPPAWSLFGEMTVSVLFALWLWRQRRVMVALVALGALLLLVRGGLLHGSLELGSDWPTMLYGIGRALFGFTLGTLIASWWSMPQRRSWIALLLVPATLVLLLPDMPVAAQLLCATVLLPLLVVAGLSVEPPAVFDRAADLLGEVSYPVYALHWPLMDVARPALKASGMWEPLIPYVTVALILLAGLAISRLVDLPARRALTALRLRSG